MKVKATKRNRDPVWYNVFKDPITNKGKISNRGVHSLIKTEDGVQSVRRDALLKNAEVLLKHVWENGQLLRDQNLKDIRALSDVI